MSIRASYSSSVFDTTGESLKIYLLPMRVLLRSMSVNSVLVGIMLLALGIWDTNWLPCVLGLFGMVFVHFARQRLELSLKQTRIVPAVRSIVTGYLIILTLMILIIDDPFVMPLTIIISVLPLVLAVMYDTKYQHLYVGLAIALYLLLLVSKVVSLPPEIVLTERQRLVLFFVVVVVGAVHLFDTYRALGIVFYQQAKESQRRLDKMRDLETDLVHRNAQLEHALQASDELSRAKTRFLHSMSHELRSPLNTVIGLSEIIALDLEAFPTEQVKEQAHQIYKAGQHLLSVIGDVLDIAKIESGTFEVIFDRVDPQQILTDLEPIIAGLKTRWPDVIYTQEISPKLPILLGEDRRIRQIFINLIDNAFKYTQHGKVAMRASADSEGIIVSVQDSGVGIPQRDLERIFDPFEQAESKHSKRVTGTGLGLAITRHLVIEHGGTLTVESVLGKGSTFTLFLPSADLTFAGQRSGKVLVVDYDPNAHVILKHWLTSAGYTPTLTSAPDTARALLRSESFNVLLLNLLLPTEDVGLQFLDEIGKGGRYTVQVVVYAAHRHRNVAAERGALYIEHPARPSKLIRTIDEAALIHARQSAMPAFLSMPS